jgi:hypothetical protein
MTFNAWWSGGTPATNTQRGVWYGSQGPQRIVIGRSLAEFSSRLTSSRANGRDEAMPMKNSRKGEGKVERPSRLAIGRTMAVSWNTYFPASSCGGKSAAPFLSSRGGVEANTRGSDGANSRRPYSKTANVSGQRLGYASLLKAHRAGVAIGPRETIQT